MTDLCGCAYPAGCGSIERWTRECKGASDNISSAIQLQCNKQCPAECNRIDIEEDIDQRDLDDYKDLLSKELNITGQSDDDIKKKVGDDVGIFREIRSN